MANTPPQGVSTGTVSGKPKRKKTTVFWLSCLLIIACIVSAWWVLARVWPASQQARQLNLAAAAPAAKINGTQTKVVTFKAAPEYAATPRPAAAASVALAAPASQPMSWDDPMDKPGDWARCGRQLKQSQLYEPNIDFVPSMKCLLMAQKLGFAHPHR